MALPTIIIFMILLAIVFRLTAGSVDHDTIRADLQSKGATDIRIEWNPFGKGWFGEKNDRIYEVTYTDMAGSVHRTWCKASLTGGVYYADDRIVSEAQTTQQEALEPQSHAEEFHVDKCLPHSESVKNKPQSPSERQEDMMRRRLEQIEREATAIRAKLRDSAKSDS